MLLRLSTSAFYKIVFVLSLFLLFFVSSITYRQLNSLNESEELVRLSDRVNLELEQLISRVKDAEAGQRGFIITRDSTYLVPYLNAIKRIDASFSRLDSLVKNNRAQRNNLTELKLLVDQRFRVLAESLEAAPETSVQPRELRISMKEGRDLMHQIREQTNAMIRAESDLLAARNTQHQTNIFLTPLSALLISIFAMLVFVASFLKINSDRKKLSRLHNEATQARIVVESERLYHGLIEGLPAALYTCDNSGRIQLYNKAAVELWGQEPETGKTLWSGAKLHLHPDGTEMTMEECPMVAMITKGEMLHIEMIIERPDGSRRTVIPHPQPIYDAAGKKIGGLNMLLDITEQKASQKALEESELRLRMAAEATRLATWDLDLDTRAIIYSPRLNEIFGYPQDHRLTHPQMRGQIHASDRPIVEAAFAEARKTGNYFYEARIVKPDQSIAWIRTEGKVQFDAAGKPVRMIGTLLDITEEKEAREQIVQSEKLFRSISLNIPNSLVLVFDSNYKVLTLEGDIVRKMGYDSSDYEGKYLYDLGPIERHNEMLPFYERVFAGETFSMERASDETGDIFMLHFVPLRDEAETIYAGLIIALDITAFKTVEDKIAMLGAIVESSEDGIISKTLDGVVTSWNKAAERIFGYTAEEMIGQPIVRLIPPERQDEEPRILEQLRSGKRVDHLETKRVRKDGTIIDISLTLSPVKNTEGEIIGASKIVRDITEQKQAEGKLGMLGAIVESSDDAIVSKTLEGIVTSWNKGAERIFGYTAEEMIGQPILTIIPPDRHDEEPQILERIRNGKRIDHFETKRVRKDGTIIDISLTLSPLKNAEGTIIGASKIARDVTKQKQAERLLRESEERFRTLVDAVPVLVWMSDTEKKCEFFNKAWLDFTGRAMQQEIGHGWAENVHPGDRESLLQAYSEHFDRREEFYLEYRLRRHDGVYRWVSDRGIPRFSPDGTFLGYIGSCTDIQEQKNFANELGRQVLERTEELNNSNYEIRQQKEFAEMILDTSIDITIVYDTEMRIISFNKAAEIKYNKTKEEMLGKTLLEVYPQIEGKTGYLDLQRAIAGEMVHNTKYRSPITELYYEDYMIPLKNTRGDVYAVLVIARDITDTIRNEELLIQLNETLTLKNTELERSNTELASFNHVASHDLQEPLRKIQTFISRIQEKDEDRLSEKGAEYFARVQSSANRMQKLIDDLLTFSRTNKADQQHERVDLNATLESVLRELGPTIEEKSAVIESDSLPVLEGIAFQFQQLFINLIGNAMKYSKPDVPPHIRVRSEQVAGSELAFLNAPIDKQFYKISVSDNGIGFEPKYARQIFELFQRLHGKMEYTGTGIGLTICKKIVENHNGYIIASGDPGVGSVFTIFLPVQ